MFHTGMKVLIWFNGRGQLLWRTDAGRTWSPVRF